ncbi:hypothetical protein C5F63_18450 [Photobacterium damselae subsp. damselae]|uniref:hypothetical protein n=1 Tax=Photobacterium damselae TaxID=38293 RepID=UPI000D07AFF4|nr:hypothetical protein [Photobacterium damselae]PSB83660.1 hypothetical protein C5F63_18450 [Photobacterium damselae subsp. damselae]
MKKTNLVLIALAAAGFVSAVNAADEGTPSTAKAKWIGSAQIIPGSKHTITGQDGALTLKDGELTLQADGTFTSTPVVMESHAITSAEGEPMVIGDKIASNWTVDSISFDWGTENTAATAGLAIDIVDQTTNTPLDKTTALEADRVDLVVSNTKPLTGVVNPAAEGTVNATIVSSYIEPSA